MSIWVIPGNGRPTFYVRPRTRVAPTKVGCSISGKRGVTVSSVSIGTFSGNQWQVATDPPTHLPSILVPVWLAFGTNRPHSVDASKIQASLDPGKRCPTPLETSHRRRLVQYANEGRFFPDLQNAIQGRRLMHQETIHYMQRDVLCMGSAQVYIKGHSSPW